MYGPTIFFAKLSLFLLYLRIFSPSRNMRLLIYAGIFVNLCYYVATAAGMMAFCMPRNGESWFLALFSSHCRRARIMTWVQGIFNIVSDLFLLILPMPVVWKLHMPTRKKWGVGAIFATGLLACVASALGLYYRIQLDSDLDWTRHEIGLCSFVVIELTLGIICGCMPYVATTLKSWTLDSGPSSFFKGFRSILSSRRHRKRSKHSRVSSDDLGESQQSQEYRLETRILGTVKGNGRFLDSRNSKQKEWLDRTMVTQQSIGERTIPEAWETADYRADYRV
ncbi:hypothetical protein MMC25_000742 [Agyrium rufum]|nr:hypothetical protein [Agyrium rufum]